MSTISRIVAGGGWKHTRAVKIKACITLVAAAVLFCTSFAAGDSPWRYLWILGILSFVSSVAFFVREKPSELGFPWDRSGHDPRNLYTKHDSIRHKQKE